MKKFIKHAVSFLLIICLVVALGCTAFATEDLPFEDVPKDAWYYDAVSACYQAGVMKGTSDTTFSPQLTMTRAMLVTTLYRLTASEEDLATDYPTSGFFDVGPDTWYTEAVDWGVYYGIVNGTSDRYFSPDDPVTREQTAALFFRVASLYVWILEDGSEISWDNGARANLNSYPDVSSVSNYAIEALQWAVANGIIQGTTSDNGTIILAPQDSATRAQVAAIIVRFAEYSYNLLPSQSA